MIQIDLDMELKSEANQREHWAKKARRVKAQREHVMWAFKAERPDKPELPVTVTLTRIAPRRFDDDNLRGAFKAVRDQVAEWLGVDDADPQVEWGYADRKGKPKEKRVIIEIGSWPW